MRPRCVQLARVLKKTGSFYCHCDWHPPFSVPIGYCIGNDQYFKRDDVGIIYQMDQMNVVPEKQRSLVGATLVKAMFDRAACGCKLFCCWCAHDIEANRFWESLGFIPLAFRAGSRERGKNHGARVHIFWQRRIREGDMTTPWWFPSQTTSGSIREDRLVFPIPLGTLWSDAKPIILPDVTSTTSVESSGIEGPGASAVRALPGKKRRRTGKTPVVKRVTIGAGGIAHVGSETFG